MFQMNDGYSILEFANLESLKEYLSHVAAKDYELSVLAWVESDAETFSIESYPGRDGFPPVVDRWTKI